MAKTQELYQSLALALKRMQEALGFPRSDPMREATIQRFEYTFELSWKLMSSILKDQGNETYGVRNIIRNAARLGLINNPERWLEFADARNLSSHIYKDEIAAKVFAVATSDFTTFAEDFLTQARTYL